VLIPYLGNYTEYRTRKRPIVLDAPTVGKEASARTTAASKSIPRPAKAENKKSVKIKVRTIEDVEREIEKAEARVKAIEEALAQAALSADAAQLTQLSSDYEQSRAQVDRLLAEWEQLATEAS